MSAIWQPQEEGLRDLLTCIEQSRSTDNALQRQVQQRFDLFNQVPDFNAYLAYVLVNPIQGVESQNRAVAGYLLVNNLRTRFLSIPAPTIEYIKSVIFTGVQDTEADVRRSAGNALTWLIRGLVPENWPRALMQLLELAKSSNAEIQENAVSTFAKICQDIPKALERVQVNGNSFLDFLIPELLQLLESSDPKIRSATLNCLTPFIEQESTNQNALSRHIDLFIAALFKRASDSSSAVRKQVCTAMVALLANRPQKLLPEINGVVDYVLHCTMDSDVDLALEACEFWLSFAEDPELHTALYPFLPRVAPTLLNCTKYDDDELFALGAFDDENDAAVPDKATDIKPRHFGASKTHAQEKEAGADAAKPGAQSGSGRGNVTTGEDEEEDEEEEEDDDDEDDEGYTEWTLRKCAAAALDVMATAFEKDLMAVLLPHLKEKLFSEDWLERESGILTIGAIAEGCVRDLGEHLTTLIPYLINTLNDAKPLIRSIACWAIGRYAAWLIPEDATSEHKQTYFVPAMENLLRMLLDDNKKVQEAGCSAFATLEEEAGAELDPFLGPVLQQLVFAFSKYQQKNLLILYDAIGTLADAVGDSLNQKELIDTLMPPLIGKWQALEDDDDDIIPLLECMSSVVIAIASGFVPYAQPVFERCVRIVHQNLVHFQTYQQNPQVYDMPDKTFLVVALDLLSGLTQGLQDDSNALYQTQEAQVFTLLILCLQYPDPAVRQSAYALLGDCAISVFPLLKRHLPQIMPHLTNQIETEPKMETVSVCNNAAWSAGELALKLQSEVEPYVNPLILRLVPLLLSNKAARSLAENAAVTIGRLGLVSPQLVAPHLEVFITNWCNALAEIKDNDEKDSAFRGICMVIQVNPTGLSKGFPFFLNAVARWQRPSAELNDMFRAILSGFKDAAGPGWQTTLSALPPMIQTRLKERYSV